MPNYREKLTYPLSDEEFRKRMQTGKFVKRPEHQGFCAFLFYTAARASEALAMKREQFRMTPKTLFVDLGERLKHSKKTPPLEIPLDAPYVGAIVDSFIKAKKGCRVWRYCRKTGYNIVHRVFFYPHYFRLSRITRFFAEGYTIAQLKSWTGLTLKALDYYVGLVSISKMGKSLAGKPGDEYVDS